MQVITLKAISAPYKMMKFNKPVVSDRIIYWTILGSPMLLPVQEAGW